MLNVRRKPRLASLTISFSIHRPLQIRRESKSSPQIVYDTVRLGVLFVRLFRSLDAIVGGDEAVARAWLANPTLALDAKPAERIRTIPGLMDVITYLDSCRSVI
jgi:Protein of unknown function (DUF2384)